MFSDHACFYIGINIFDNDLIDIIFFFYLLKMHLQMCKNSDVDVKN